MRKETMTPDVLRVLYCSGRTNGREILDKHYIMTPLNGKRRREEGGEEEILRERQKEREKEGRRIKIERGRKRERERDKRTERIKGEG